MSMPVSLQMEHYLYLHRTAWVRQLARKFQISERRCRDELEVLQSYGVEIDADGRVSVPVGV